MPHSSACKPALWESRRPRALWVSPRSTSGLAIGLASVYCRISKMRVQTIRGSGWSVESMPRPCQRSGFAQPCGFALVPMSWSREGCAPVAETRWTLAASMRCVAHPGRVPAGTMQLHRSRMASLASVTPPHQPKLAGLPRRVQLSAPLISLHRPLAVDRQPWTCAWLAQTGGAGGGACAAAAVRKRDHYAAVLDELHEEGYDYRPLVWTCWGRPSPEAAGTLRTLAQVAARRKGLAEPAALEGRARALIGAHIWRRAAAMVLACMDRCRQEDVAELLAGVGFEEEELAL